MITGRRVRLRAVEHSDVPCFKNWINDPEVTAGLLIVLPMSLDQEEQWYAGLEKRLPEERPLAIEARVGDGWKLIGSSGYHNIDWRNRQGEVGIFIGDKSYWGRGYGSEAMAMLVRHGFDTLNLHRIYLQVISNNTRAIHSYERIGFVHEGRLRHDIFKNGQYLDVHIMSVLSDEWQRPEFLE